MNLLIKILLGFIVFVLGVGVGGRFMFAPESTGAEFGMAFDGARALNQVRGDIGGVFVALAVVTLLGMVRREPRYFEAVAICMLGVMLARILGFAVDGDVQAESVVAALAELIIAGVLLYAARMPSASESAAT
jgi:hypothetical protein